MKMNEIPAHLLAHCDRGDTTAMAALLLASKIDDLRISLDKIDGVLTEIRSAIEYAAQR